MLRELLKKFDQNFPLLLSFILMEISEQREEILIHFAAGELSFREADHHSRKARSSFERSEITPPKGGDRMIQFNMNIIQSTRMVQGNNYTKNAGESDLGATQTGMFDAKQ